MIVAKFSTLSGGVWIEDAQDGGAERTGAERCWRFDKDGRAEYAILADISENPAPRWFGHVYTERDFILA